MRLGAYPCTLVPGTRVHEIYGTTLISERHRHRYEFNNKYRALFEKKGMTLSGICEERDLVEIIELSQHPWFIGVQFHPEFKSRPLSPHPLFKSFVEAALHHRKTVRSQTSQKRSDASSARGKIGVRRRSINETDEPAARRAARVGKRVRRDRLM